MRGRVPRAVGQRRTFHLRSSLTALSVVQMAMAMAGASSKRLIIPYVRACGDYHSSRPHSDMMVDQVEVQSALVE